MPDPIVVPNPMDPDAIAAHNNDISRKVASQDIMGKSLTPSETEPAQSALDKLFQENESRLKAAAGGKEAPNPDEAPPKPTTKPDATDPRNVTPPDPAAVKAAEEASAAEAAKAAAAAEPTAEQKRAEEIFKDAPKLPTGASPKSADAFNHVKVEAARRLMELETKLTKAVEELETEKKRASSPSTEQLEKDKEYQDLKNWRAKVDVQFDPAFKQFDKQISEASEFVYAQLKKSPKITDEHIDLIKKYGGPHKIVLKKLFAEMDDPTLQRIVEAQVSDIAKLEYQKERKIDEAKANVEQYQQERENHWKQQATAHTTETQRQLDPLLKSLDWFALKKVEDSAAPETKKAAEEHNTFVSELQNQIQGALNEDTPQMRAVLIAGLAQLFNLQREHKSTKASLAATEKERDTILAKLEKIKSSATTRLREGAAPAEGVRQPAKPAVTTSTRTQDAVDALARQVMEERQAKGLPV